MTPVVCRAASLVILAVVGAVVGPIREVRAAPAVPPAALAAGVGAVGARLGVPVDSQAVLEAARLHPGLAGRLTTLLVDLAACHDATSRLLRTLPAPLPSLVADQSGPVSIPGAAAVRACAARVQGDGLELQRFLAARSPAMGGDVDLWPVLRLDLDGTDDTVVHDYVLSVDRGGNDRYYNSAGGNALDVRRGPPGSAAPEPGEARGCVNPSYDLHEGQCVLSAALLVDVAGDDTYGRMEVPDADAICTDEPLVRRVLTAGAGFAGAGILLDGAGDDHYVGKAVTQGAGHIGGVGVLRDAAGDDTYLALRLSKGFGTIQGLGVLHDLGGDDRYTYYMPRALDPAAAYKTPGSGGGLSTTGLCDNQPRWDEGTGILGGVGVLVEDGGDDVYEAGAPLDHLLGTTDPLRRTGSLGFGDMGGFGLMVDHSGGDRYSAMPGRADGAVVMPTGESTGLFVDRPPDTAAVATGESTGLFVDRPPDTAAPTGSAGLASPGLVAAYAGHFVPPAAAVERGGSVRFVNVDGMSRLEHPGHTVTELRPEGPPRFDSGLVPFGEAAEVDGVGALPPGRYPFFCRVHPFMRGTIVVR